MDSDLSVVGVIFGFFMILYLAWTIFKLINSRVVMKRNGPVLFYLNDYFFQSMAAPQAIYLCLLVLGRLILSVLVSLAGKADIPIDLFLIVAPTLLFGNMLQFAFCSRVGVTREGLIYSRLHVGQCFVPWGELESIEKMKYQIPMAIQFRFKDSTIKTGFSLENEDQEFISTQLAQLLPDRIDLSLLKTESEPTHVC